MISIASVSAFVAATVLSLTVGLNVLGDTSPTTTMRDPIPTVTPVATASPVASVPEKPVEAPQTPVERPKAAERVSGSDHLDRIAQCESGGRANAVNPSGKYRGAFQFDQRTWEANGGSGDPAAASYAEQKRIAQNLYARRGAQPWPHCGRM